MEQSTTSEMPQPQSTSMPQPSVATPRTNKNKLIFLIGIILLLMSVSSIIYYLNQNTVVLEISPSPAVTPVSSAPSPEEIGDWKTYKNEDFSFRYPPYYTESNDAGLLNDPQGNYIFAVHPFDDVDTTLEVYKRLCPVAGFCSEVKSGQLDSSIQFLINGAHYPSVETIVEHNGGIYTIALVARETVAISEEAKSIYRQILSSFEFIDTPKIQVNFEQQCVSGGGTWKQFANDGQYCHDECNRPVGIACLRNTSFGCDCGTSACWDGSVCVSE